MTVVYAIQDFIEQGGPVLWLIFLACLLLWSLILERIWFVRISWPRRARGIVNAWNAREDCRSWRAKKIRELLVSERTMQLQTASYLAGWSLPSSNRTAQQRKHRHRLL